MTAVDRRVTDVVRETWVDALVTHAPEHTAEAAALMAAHRRAPTDRERARRWHRALALVTRPSRRAA